MPLLPAIEIKAIGSAACCPYTHAETPKQHADLHSPFHVPCWHCTADNPGSAEGCGAAESQFTHAAARPPTADGGAPAVADDSAGV